MTYTEDKLSDYRQKGDEIADQAILFLKQHPTLKNEIQSLASNRALSSWSVEGPIRDLVRDITKEKAPAFLKGGHAFFESRVFSIMALLGLYSLPYCYAAANGAKVLIHSKNIIDNPGQRLGETAQFVLEVCRKGAFAPEGRGYVSILKVRLMHAAIRHHASRHIDFETPVNQEDMAGTNLTFSLLIIRGLQKLGGSLSEQEIQDYLQMWNFIGERLGIEKELLPTSLKDYYLLERAIRKHQFKKSIEGDRLMEALLGYFEKNQQTIPGFSPRVAMAALMGNEVADYLNLTTSDVAQSAALTLMRGSRFFLNFISDHYGWVSRSISSQLDNHEFEDMFVIPV